MAGAATIAAAIEATSRCAARMALSRSTND